MGRLTWPGCNCSACSSDSVALAGFKGGASSGDEVGEDNERSSSMGGRTLGTGQVQGFSSISHRLANIRKPEGAPFTPAIPPRDSHKYRVLLIPSLWCSQPPTHPPTLQANAGPSARHILFRTPPPELLCGKAAALLLEMGSPKPGMGVALAHTLWC